MPLDGHSYLVSQGWGGRGTGLRPGAISRAIAIPKKKNLAGVGKDRDEAFPFWDHLFTAASKSIQIKCGSSDGSDDEEEDRSEDNSSSGVGNCPSTKSRPQSHEPTGSSIKRTATGIPSTRRPIQTFSASSTGDTTPESDGVIASSMSRLTLLAQAKRAAARKGLYARFYRGEVLAVDVKEAASSSSSPVVAAAVAVATAPMKMMAILDSSKTHNEGRLGEQSPRDTEDSRHGEEEGAKTKKEKEEKRKRREERSVAKEQRRKEKEEKRQRKAEKRQRKQELEVSSSHNPTVENSSTIPKSPYPSTSVLVTVRNGDDTDGVVELAMGSIPQSLDNEEVGRAERRRKKEAKEKKREAKLGAVDPVDEDNDPREAKSKKRKRKTATENEDDFNQEVKDDDDEGGRPATKISSSEKSKDKKLSKKKRRQQEHTTLPGRDDDTHVVTSPPAKKKKKKDAV